MSLCHSVNRSDAHSQARCNLAPGNALGAKPGNPCDLHIALRPAELLSSSPGLVQAGADPLADQLALKLGDAGEDAEHGGTHVRTRARKRTTARRHSTVQRMVQV